MPPSLSEILAVNARERRISVIANMTGAAVSFLLISAIAFMVLILLPPFNLLAGRHLGLLAMVSAAMVIILTIVGLITERRLYTFDESDLFPSFEARSADAYLARRELPMVTGPAYIISQTIMFTANAIYRTHQHAKKSISMSGDELREAGTLLAYLRSKGTSPRFHALPALSPMASRALAKLLFADVVRQKMEAETMLIGLNRRFD